MLRAAATMSRSPIATAIVGFSAGALAVPLVHQPILWLLHQQGWAPWPAFSLAPTGPLAVPALLSVSFWGGVWGLPLALLLRHTPAPRARWLRAALFGAIAPNVVGALLIHFGHGPALSRGHVMSATISAVVINLCWAVGAAALMERYSGRV